MLSTSCKYGLRAVFYLALPDNRPEVIGIKKISEDLDIPAPYLAKILQLLSKGRILKSTKGPGGGFRLGKKPEDITLFEIVKMIDGTSFFDNCVIGIRDCHQEGHVAPCALHEQFHQIRCNLKHLFLDTRVDHIISGKVDIQNVISL